MTSRSNELKQALPAAILGAWCFLGLELFWVSELSRQQFAGRWEVGAGTAALAPGALLLAAAVAAGWNALLVSLGSGRKGVRVAGLCVVALASLALAYGLTQGRHFELWWRRAGFMALFAVLGVSFAGWVGPRLNTFPKSRLVAASALLLLLCESVNRWVLVRLYPPFHWALTLLAIGLSVVLARVLVSIFHERFPQGLAPRAAHPRWQGVQRHALWSSVTLVCAISAVRLPSSAERLARFDNFRWVLLERAPILGHTVQALALIAKPPPITEPTNVDDPAASGDFVALRDRDLLLITIDALRADHLGSYGYARAKTPHMDQLAQEGKRFEFAYTATPHTSYAITSLMTGKYIRPLLLQGLGQDSETWAQIARAYGYRTAAFYPPAVFFIDTEMFAPFADTHLGFEYQKKEFLEGEPRVQQVVSYLKQQPKDQRLFTWVHLFGPHEPYVKDARFDFGDRDIDRYDSEVAAADHTVGRLVEEYRKARPNAVVIVTSDHGEEFGEHGGRYHGSSVYEEQVRVPLLIAAKGAIEPGVYSAPVQTIDLLPTVLRALEIPQRPRIRGRDLGAILAGKTPKPTADTENGFAYAETEEHSLLAEGPLRLVCARRVGACRLFDVVQDPSQTLDLAGERPRDFNRLKQRLRSHNASHGHFERGGAKEEHGAWPAPILRGIAGDGDAAVEVAALLDDAEVRVRRKAAELLFALANPETPAALQLALERDEDETVRRYAALALTRLGQAAALTLELLSDPDVSWRRRAALVLAETGDRRGHLELVGWWQQRESAALDFRTSQQVLAALGKSRSKEAVWPLVQSLDDVRLRPDIARALAQIGDDTARGPLSQALLTERYQGARTALADALHQLGAGTELVVPLRRWLGVPDPIEQGVRIATEAKLLEHLGGPTPRELARVRENAQFGELVRIVVPPGGNGQGVRLIVRANNPSDTARWVRVGLPTGLFTFNSQGEAVKSRKVPEIHPNQHLTLSFPPGDPGSERVAAVPPEFGLEPGRASFLVVLAEAGLQFESLVVVPLQDEPAGVPVPSSKDPAPALVPGSQEQNQ